MAKPTFSEVASAIQDPLLSDNFLLVIPNVPGGGVGEALRLQCRSASKPGKTINSVEVAVFGHVLEFASNISFSHDMSVSYAENGKAQVTTALELWQNAIRSAETQLGAPKSAYARNGIFYVYDNVGNVVKEYLIEAMWPAQVPDISFDGSSSSALNVDASFKYDRVITVK